MVRTLICSLFLSFLGVTTALGDDFQGELRPLGKVSQKLKTTTPIKEGDLIQINKGQFRFELGSTLIQIGEGSLVGIGQGKNFLEVYRGSANLQTQDQPFILLNGSSQLKLLPGSSAFWATQGDQTHISLHQGKAHLLTPSEGKVLLPGMGAMIQSGKITSNTLAINLDENLSAMSTKRIQKIFESSPEFVHRYESLGLLENFNFEDPKEVIFYYLDILKRSRWASYVERGENHLLAQKILLLEKSHEAFPESLQVHLKRTPVTISLFKDFSRLDQGLASMEETDRVFITFFVRQAMAEELIAKKELRDSIVGYYRIASRHQQNVTESPDDSTTPSDKQGASLSQQFQLKWTGLTNPWGRPSLSLRLSDRNFFDSDFKAREVSTISFNTKLNRTIGKKGDTILEINPGYNIRFDFVNSTSGRELNFFTHSPQVEIVFAPIQESGNWSDLIFHFWKAGIDHRQYATDSRHTATGLQRDVSTFWTTWVGINAIRWKGFRVQESLSLDMRTSISEDPILEYDLFNLNFSASLRQENWEVKPLFAIQYRNQKDFRGPPRKDFKHEVGINATSFKAGNWADLSLGYRYISQTSTQESFFDYIDQQWSMSLIKSF